MKRYPAEDLTPHAAYHTLNGRHPIVTLTAFDDSARFTLMGGPAIPNRFTSPAISLRYSSKAVL